MSLRQIRVMGDEILRKTSREITEINQRITDLLDDMAETMYANEGVGLAAPQVGVLRRMAVIDVGDGLYELINPVILESEGEETEFEACLSVPEYIGEVKRPLKVKVRAQNRNGETYEFCADGFFARAVCHELDHLDGIVFLDKAVSIKKKEDEENEE